MGDGVKMHHWNLHAYCTERVRPYGPPGPETVIIPSWVASVA